MEDQELDIAQVVADADAELDALEDQILNQTKAGAATVDAPEKKSLVGVIYENGTQSEFINPNRFKTLRVFEAKFGRLDQKNIDESMWLVWHSLGRPGANGKRPESPALGPLEDQVFEAWRDSIEEPTYKQVEVGKALP